MWCISVLLVCLCNQILAIPFDFESISEPKKIFYNIAEYENLFQEYLQTYSKSYEGDEYGRRLELFKRKLEKLNQMNEENESTVFGINQFSDMTDEEREAHTNCFSTEVTKANNCSEGRYRPSQAPDSLDYTKKNWVTPAKDQMACGSCYIFSSTGNIEGQYAKKYGNLLSFSEQQILDCDNIDYKCNGGLPENVFSYLMQKGGLELEADYPYTSEAGDCVFDATKVKVRLDSCQILDIVHEEDMKSALNEFGPLSIGIFASEGFIEYKGGILEASSCPDTKDLNHAILLVGYTPDYWIVKNSWGPGWGYQGFGKFRMGHKTCGIGRYVATSAVL